MLPFLLLFYLKQAFSTNYRYIVMGGAYYCLNPSHVYFPTQNRTINDILWDDRSHLLPETSIIHVLVSAYYSRKYDLYFIFVLLFIVHHRIFLVVRQSFGTYTWVTEFDLTPDVAFSSLALFNLLGGPLFLFPLTMFLLVNGIISTSRLQFFLAAPEVEGCKAVRSSAGKKSAVGKRVSGNGGHVVRNWTMFMSWK